MKGIELDEYGREVWRHKTNKRLFLHKPYRWVDRLIMIDEAGGRQVIDEYLYSTYDLGAWTPVTKEEEDKVEVDYTEIYK